MDARRPTAYAWGQVGEATPFASVRHFGIERGLWVKAMPQVRCPFCHEYVDADEYPTHEARHTEVRPDGQRADYATLPPGEREQGDLVGVPRVYVHRNCGVATGMPEGVIRTYLADPYRYMTNRTFCDGCGDHVPFEECSWTETGENLQAYMDELRTARGIMVLPTQEGELGQCECCGCTVQTVQGTWRTPGYNGGYFMYGAAGGSDRHVVRIDLLLRRWAAGQNGAYLGVAADWHRSGSPAIVLADARDRPVAGSHLAERGLTGHEASGSELGQAALAVAAAILREDGRVVRYVIPELPAARSN